MQLKTNFQSKSSQSNYSKWKKRSETQTLHAGCSKVEPKNFRPTTDPFPGAQDGQNLISWRWSLPLPINPVWWGSMHANSSYRGNRPTNKHTHTHPQTGPITIHRAAASEHRNKRQVTRNEQQMLSYGIITRQCRFNKQQQVSICSGTARPPP